MLDKIYHVLPNRQLVIIGLVFLHLSLAIVYFISDSITGNGFDESVVYFLHTGADGLETSGYRYLFVSTAFLILLCLYVCIKLGRSRYLNYSVNAIKVLGVNVALIALLFFQPAFNVLATQPLYDIITGTSSSIELEIPGDIKIPHKKNIVYLYLESFERSFLDETHFPGLAPNIRELETQGLAFTNIDTAFGARWTIAGMVASQCGLLLETDPPGVNTPGAFMPGSVCLGETLKQNGYVTSYLGGASLRFGGKGNFYKTHQFDSVQGLEHHMKVLPLETTSYSEWGLYDEDLYPLAWKEFTRLQSQHKPFALFLLTLDTHPPDGLPSSSCDNIRYGDGKNAMLNALHCSDRLAANFIRRLLASEAAAGTIIVVASDHLMMANDASKQLKQHPNRRNLFFILERNGRQESLDKHASPFDIAPTLLSVLGTKTEGYNLGVSLLGDNKTIMERIEDPDTALRHWSRRQGKMLY